MNYRDKKCQSGPLCRKLWWTSRGGESAREKMKIPEQTVKENNHFEDLLGGTIQNKKITRMGNSCKDYSQPFNRFSCRLIEKTLFLGVSTTNMRVPVESSEETHFWSVEDLEHCACSSGCPSQKCS